MGQEEEEEDGRRWMRARMRLLEHCKNVRATATGRAGSDEWDVGENSNSSNILLKGISQNNDV